MKNFKEYLSESIYKEETYEGDDFFEAYGVLWFNEDGMIKGAYNYYDRKEISKAYEKDPIEEMED